MSIKFNTVTSYRVYLLLPETADHIKSTRAKLVAMSLVVLGSSASTSLVASEWAIKIVSLPLTLMV